MLAKIKEMIKGKKTYILGSIAVVTAIVTWASNEITGVQLVTAVFVALQTMFIRAGIKKVEI